MAEEKFARMTVSRMRTALAYRFHLRDDQSGFDEIDQNIRGGIEVKGTNLWVLMLAIFIASIGLNVNSTAVIIGAMLISPLMGPIMGVGYGAGINDYPLIKKAFGNLLVSIFIALTTSTLYFLISPLSAAQSELLARTTPTIWDVLIALFGGFAGIIALTRKEKSNVIPGVAIATALMPPLCTAGYGLANGSLEMFFGAFYLFIINCVFIAFATLLLVSYINPPHKQFVSEERERTVKRYIYAVVLCTVLPSIYLAYGLVTSELFDSRANEFIKNELAFENSFIAKQQINADKREINIYLVGDKIGDKRLAELSGKLEQYRIPEAKLNIHQTVIKQLDEASLKKSLLTEILSANQVASDSKNKEIQDLQNEVSNLKEQQSKQADYIKGQEIIFNELVAQYPQVQKLAMAKTDELQTSPDKKQSVLLVDITSKKALSRADRRRIAAWLKVRTGTDLVKLGIAPDQR
jgi:uncharacterized hydrophobic protein (TIGR00271 family)